MKYKNLKIILSAKTGQGGNWEFTGSRVLLFGRDACCQVRPRPGDDLPGLSRFHAALELESGRAWLRDLGSLMGTWLNGHLIGRGGEGRERKPGAAARGGRKVELADGDVVALGPWWFRVLLVEADQAYHARMTRVCPGCGRPLDHRLTLPLPDALCRRCRAKPSAALKLLEASGDLSLTELAPLRDLRIGRPLGRGSSSAVYLVVRRQSQARLALKVMPPQVADNDWSRRSFLREAALGRVLRHPNVVRMFESGSFGGVHFVLMEHCRGGSCEEERVRAGGRLTVRRALAILLPVLDGLEYLHSVRLGPAGGGGHPGLVHRDLKPANIFLGGEDGTVPKIADIGVAKFQGRGGTCDTRTGTVAGSPATMPRQQALNFKNAGPEVDVWAAAATFYKLVCGEYPRPFAPDRDPWEVVMRSACRPLADLLPQAPVHLASVVDQALADEEGLRHQTAAGFKAAVLAAASADGLEVEVPVLRADGESPAAGELAVAAYG